MRVLLMNSAMMPEEGIYIAVKIDKKRFCELLKLANKQGVLKSYIGYPQNAELIKKWTGVEVEVNREKAELEDRDFILVMKLKYRVANPADKGKEVNEEDFEFFLIKYLKELPLEEEPSPAFPIISSPPSTSLN